MIGTIETSHTVLNPSLRHTVQSSPSAAVSPPPAGVDRTFSSQLQGKFFADNSLTGTTRREEAQQLAKQKAAQRHLALAKVAAKQAAKLQANRAKAALQRKRKRLRAARRAAALARLQGASVLVQRAWRGHIARAWLHRVQRATLVLQLRVRAWVKRRRGAAARQRAAAARQRFREAAAARLLQRAYVGHRNRVARVSAAVMLQRKVRRWRDNRVTYRIIAGVARRRRQAAAKKIQRCYVRFYMAKRILEYERSVREARARKKAEDAAKRMDLRRDFQRRRHLLLNKIYHESAVSLLERMMETRGVSLNMEFRVDGADIHARPAKRQGMDEEVMLHVARETTLHDRILKQRQKRAKRRPKPPKKAPTPVRTKPKPASGPVDDKPDWNGHFTRPASSHRRLSSRPPSSSSSRPRSRPTSRSSSRPGTPTVSSATGGDKQSRVNQLLRTQGPSSRGGSRSSSRNGSRDSTPKRKGKNRDRNSKSRGNARRPSRPSSRQGTPKSRSRRSTPSRRPSTPSNTNNSPRSSAPPTTSRPNSSRSARSSEKKKRKSRRRKNPKPAVPAHMLAKLSAKSKIGHFDDPPPLPVSTMAVTDEYDGDSEMLQLGKAELLILDKVTSTDHLPKLRSHHDHTSFQNFAATEPVTSVEALPPDYYENLLHNAQEMAQQAEHRQQRMQGNIRHVRAAQKHAQKRSSIARRNSSVTTSYKLPKLGKSS